MIVKQRGFTLIEVIIVVGLVGIMVIVISEFFFGTQRMYQTQDAELRINMTVRTSLDDIDAYLRQATRVVSSYSTYMTGSETLVIELKSVNISSQLIPGTYDTIVYYLDNGNLFREIFPNAGSTRIAGRKLVGENITSLTFAYNNADYALVTLVSTEITASLSTGKEARSITLSSKARLRN